MGFSLSVSVDLPEDEWRYILRIVSRRGVSRLEGLGDLERVLEPQEAREPERRCILSTHRREDLATNPPISGASGLRARPRRRA